MTRRLPIIAASLTRPRRGAGDGSGMARAAFTIVELLVVMAIMIVLLGLTGAAVSGARASSKKQQTQLLISKLDAIVQQQFATYASSSVVASGVIPADMTKAAYRGWFIRRNLITGDLPDRWTDVKAIATGTLTVSGNGSATLPITAQQRVYAAIWNGFANKPTDQYAGAECLFMIVMQGGIADCLDCGELKTGERGDKDNDGAFEFWDQWGNPIGFILWPSGLELPAGSTSKFFSGTRSLLPSATSSAPALGMRPLIYSAGPDGEYGFERNSESEQLTAGSSPVGRDCGNWEKPPAFATPSGSVAADNITNLDGEARQ